MCYSIPILKSEDEFFGNKEVKEVDTLPDGFCKWIDENSERVAAAEKNGTLPYWLSDNPEIKGCALMISQANESRSVLQDIAFGVADNYDASVTPMNIKSFKSLYRKITNPNEIVGLDDVKDVLRCTIVADGKDIPRIKDELVVMEGFMRYKEQNTPYGYTGQIVNFVMPNGLKTEIQINTAEMIYAKEVPSIAKRIIGEDTWTKISKRTKVEGGLGHKYYEEGRVLDIVKDLGKIEALQKKSRAYYKLFR